MAAISFKEELVVCDPKKAEEIARALKQPRDGTVHPSAPPPLPDNADAVWFSPEGK